MADKDINRHLDSNCSEYARGDKPVHAAPAAAKSKPAVAPIFSMSTSQKAISATQPVTPRATSSFASTKKRSAGSSVNAEAGPSKRTKSSKLSSAAPLAERLRPQSLEEFVGQPHLTGHDSLLMNLVRSGSIGSLILWGPPGYVTGRVYLDVFLALTQYYRCGKTTLSRLLAKSIDASFKELSATDSGISDIRAVAEEAKGLLNLTGR